MRRKESYKEQRATDFGHKRYAGSGDAPGVASSFAKARSNILSETHQKMSVSDKTLWRIQSILNSSSEKFASPVFAKASTGTPISSTMSSGTLRKKQISSNKAEYE
jgi:hypothetical protein